MNMKVICDDPEAEHQALDAIVAGLEERHVSTTCAATSASSPAAGGARSMAAPSSARSGPSTTGPSPSWVSWRSHHMSMPPLTPQTCPVM